MKTPIFFLLILLLGSRLHGQIHQDNLDSAFNQLKGNGLTPFARALYEDTDSANNFIHHLDPLMRGAGEFLDYEILSIHPLAKKINRMIIVIYFEKFPMYLRLDTYDTPKGRIYLSPLASKEASDVLPPDLIAVSGK